MSEPNDTAPRSRRRRPAVAPGTPPADTVGGDLERRIARLEFAEGALARLRVPVAADGSDSSRNVLTDMDILSVEVDARLRITRSSLECKSGARQSGEAMTIVWLAGFRQLMELDRVVYVRPSVNSRARALATRLQIGVLDETTIASREKAITWVPQRFAHVDGPECTAAEKRTDTQLKGLPFLRPELTAFLRHEALLADSHEILAALDALGNAIDRQGSLPSPASHVLSGHALIALLAAGMADAGRLDHESIASLRRRLERALTTGDPNDISLLDALGRADDLMRHVVDRIHRTYVSAGASPTRVEIPSLREAISAPPLYLDDYLDFVQRLRVNPLIARDLLQTAELLSFDALLGGSGWRAPAFSRLFTVEHQGLLLVALRCLRAIGGEHASSPLNELSEFFKAVPLALVPDRRSAPPSRAAGDDVARVAAGDGMPTADGDQPTLL
ncbi:hypothetical protein ACTVBU_10725 [Sanguibacter sp. A246]|uniref:hypothetical protein n=1 Tax=Sanguibacter sp. A246 TaxID=3457326 RepID=UPI003FD70187